MATLSIEGSFLHPTLTFDTDPHVPFTRWDGTRWWAQYIEGKPTTIFRGFTVAHHPAFVGNGENLDQLTRPYAAMDLQGNIRVLPRLKGRENTAQLLRNWGQWEEDTQSFRIGLSALEHTRHKLSLSPRVVAFLNQERTIPSWFGLDLFDYQREGALLAASGHRFICEPMGLGKTRTSLAALACFNPEKVIIVVPPVMLSDWEKQVEKSMLAGGEVDVIRSGKWKVFNKKNIPIEEKPLPERGVIVVPDSLIASRPKLLSLLASWGSQGLIVDEIHRAKTWNAKRSKVLRDLSRHVNGPVFGLTGTPLFAQPEEMCGPLEIVRLLDPVFTSRWAFTQRFTFEAPWGGRLPLAGKMPELRQILDEKVWVRHDADEVLDLPVLTRQARYVDVDLKEYRQAHKDVIDTIKQWVKDIGGAPEEDEIRSFCKDSLRLVSTLRVAAGRCKGVAAKEYIEQWIEENKPGEGQAWDNPLVVWTHHHEVTELMEESIRDLGVPTATIKGGVSPKASARIVEDFQAGTIGVLVASIHAAGVGITLTRANMSLFVETDWTPAIVSQAEHRTHRIGQKRNTMSVTLIAPGTLDETIQLTLERKGKTLTPLLGESSNVAVSPETATASTILYGLVKEVLDG